MATVIIISAIAIIIMIASILFFPTIKVGKLNLSTYWMVALLGAIMLIVFGCIDAQSAWQGLTADTSVNPIKILVLFLSMSVLSIFLDEIGFFSYLANKTLKSAKSNQFTLFLSLYALVSLLTIFTSNDIIILTFTPFICYFAKNARIDPVPYLVAEYVAANTWSLVFVIGNPTNIYLATTFGIDFVEYFSVMALPALAGGVVSLALLLLIFGKKLSQKTEITELKECDLGDKGMLIIGLLHLGLCTVMLIISSYINVEMWLITLCFAISLFICVTIYRLAKGSRPRALARTLKRAPWELIPFVFSMFVIVLSLDKQNVTAKLTELLGEADTVFRYGFASTLTANFINNIPMSVLFCSVLKPLEGATLQKGIFASIVGSDIGALITPIGSLAGIMWNRIVKGQEVKYSFGRFLLNGVLIGLPALVAILAVLNAVL